MVEDNYFLDYMMLPRDIEGIGKVYPIKLCDYFYFKRLANKYIIYGKKWLVNICKQPKNVNLFDYIINTTIRVEAVKKINTYIPKNEEESIKLNQMKKELNDVNNNLKINMYIYEIEALLELVLHKKVTFINISDNEFCFKGEDVEINRNNFDILRETIMSQNLLNEPPSSPSPFINDMMNKRLEEYNKKNKGGDICCMMSIISSENHLTEQNLMNYTYYRLSFEYNLAMKKMTNYYIYMLRSQGADEEIIDLSEPLDLTFDVNSIFIDKNGKATNSLDKKLQNK